MKTTILAGGIASAIALAGVASMPAWAQADGPTSSPALPQQTRALIEEIGAYGESDQSQDPEGDLKKLADLEKRVAADGRVPALDRGLLSSAIGAAHFYARQFDKAAERYGEAAVLFEEGKAPPEEMAGLYNNQAAILASIGRYAEAEESHRKALAIRKGMEGERGPKVASSLFGIAYVYYRQGRLEESIGYFRDAVEQQLEFVGPSDPQSIMRLTSLASVLGRSGREAEALDVARRAEALGREHLGESHPTYAIALNNLGNALIEGGLFAQAVPVLRECLRVRRQTIGEEASGTALSLRNLATALKQTGREAEAEELTRAAIAIYEKTGEVETPFALAYMYADLAGSAADRGDWQAYEPLAQKSLDEADKRLAATDHDRAHIHLSHAQWLHRRGEAAKALAIAEQWVPVMQEALIPGHKDRIWAELLLARLRQQGGEQSWTLADAAVSDLSARLSDLGATDLGLVREAATNRESALLYFEMAASTGDQKRAFEALQLATLTELALGQQFAAESRAEEDSAWLKARRALLDLGRKVEEVRSRYGAALEAEDGQAAALLQAELDRLEEEKTHAEQTLRRDFPELVARHRPRPIPLDQLREALGAKDMIVTTLDGAGRSWAVTIDRSQMVWHEADGAAIGDHVRAIRASVENADSPFPLARAHALYRELFPAGMKKGTRILQYGGGRLSALPLSLLLTRAHDGELRDAPWLVRDASFQVVGNLALLDRRTPADTRKRGEVRMAGIGGPDLPRSTGSDTMLASLFRSGRPDTARIAELPFLPNAERELQEIANALPGESDVLMIGPDAREENVKAADLSGADVLVFATHGLVAGEMRGLWEPALLLGTRPGEGDEDGLLGASEIARMKLDADWVILSACNTSAGDGMGGAVYSGLATAFAQAGARALMLSHWRIRDDAASQLTVATVRGAARGLDRAEALRRAQLSMIKSRTIGRADHPSTWAAFVIVQNR